MPSWIVHLATAAKVSEKIDCDIIKNNLNSFFMGNLVADAERHVIKDFSICVPYNISHFSEFVKIDGKIEELPNIDNFLESYKNKLQNPIVLGYLTHLLTDYYWNKITYHRYSLRDKEGNAIGLILNDETKVECRIKERSRIKHGDFALFENYIINQKEYIVPKYEECILELLDDIKEIPFVKSDIIKIIDYVKIKSEEKCVIGKYKLFTKEQILTDYEESINFIVEFLNKLNVI